MPEAFDKAFARLMNERIERQMLAAIGATTTNIATAQDEPLTLAKLEEAMAKLPPRERWAVSALFPRDRAMIAKTPDETLTLIHPDMWTLIAHELRRKPAQESNAPAFELRPIFIDPDPLDTPEHARFRANERKRIMGLFTAALTVAIELGEVTRQARLQRRFLPG